MKSVPIYRRKFIALFTKIKTRTDELNKRMVAESVVLKASLFNVKKLSWLSLIVVVQ